MRENFSGCREFWYRALGATSWVLLAACGERARLDEAALGSVQSEIVGGVVAAPGEGEFVAALFQDVDGEFRHICGGTFVAADLVVTAAHCSFGITAELEEQHQVVVG